MTVNHLLIKTGSSGNCIIYEDKVMVDIGVSYKLLKDNIDNVKVIMLSHLHADHIKTNTLKRIVKQLPNVVIMCGIWFKPLLDSLELPVTVNVVYCDHNKWYKVGNMMFCPVSLYHDVANFGWRIKINGKKIFHATDTVKMEGITSHNDDLIAIEAHHITSVIDKTIEDKLNAGVFCYEVGSKNSHLSEEDADEWINANKSEFTEVLKLHYSYCYDLIDGKLKVKEKENE